MHLHEPSKEEYNVAARGYSYVKSVFTAALLKIQCIWYIVVLHGLFDSEGAGSDYHYEAVYHWTQHNNPEDLNTCGYACIGLHPVQLLMSWL